MTTTTHEPDRIDPLLPFPDYLAHPAYGSSSLKDFRALPAMVQWKRNNPDNTETPATRLGTAAHCAILTPDLFDETFAVAAEGQTFRSNADKAWKADQEAAGLTVLSHNEAQQVLAIAEAFNKKPAAFEALQRAVFREASVFWTCPESGLQCKGRPDWFTEDYVYDLKISVEATKSYDQLVYRCQANGWFGQLAHNRAGLNACGFKVRRGRLVVIAPKPPHAFRVWLLDVKEDDLDFLELENSNTRAAMRDCERRGYWPGTPDDWQTIELPSNATWTELDTEGVEEVL